MAELEELHKTISISKPDDVVEDFVEKYLDSGMRILDLGCGKGRHTLYCAQKGVEVHAVDISESGLEALGKEVEKAQLFEKVKVTKSDIKELPFPDNYFDAIITTNVIQHGYWKDIQKYFKEATRVLKHGGMFLILTIGKEFVEQFSGPNTKEVEKGTYVGLETVPDGDVPHHAMTEDEIMKLLKDYDIIKLEEYERRSQWIKDCDVKGIEIVARKK